MDRLPNDPAEALLHTYSVDGGINYLAATRAPAVASLVFDRF